MREMRIALIALLMVPALAIASGTKGGRFKVTVTNMTQKQILTMPVVSIHHPRFSVFKEGEAATRGLALLAEDGIVNTLLSELNGNARVFRAAAFADNIFPGQSRSTVISTNKSIASVRLSLVSMLATSNDAFAALSRVRLPRSGTVQYDSAQYDAGSEANTELCEHVPGPPCGSHNARVRNGAEGSVSAFGGIQGVGDLGEEYNVNGAAAKITIEKLPF